jgi:hypothetical protein
MRGMSKNYKSNYEQCMMTCVKGIDTFINKSYVKPSLYISEQEHKELNNRLLEVVIAGETTYKSKVNNLLSEGELLEEIFSEKDIEKLKHI